MEIIYKKIEEIKEYEKNPRKNDEAVKYVAESIKEFGFKVPIVIDENGVIVAGHTWYKAAKKLKMKELPCTVAVGLDFGYVQDPSALFVGFVDMNSRKLYVWDEFYEKGMSNKAIAEK